MRHKKTRSAAAAALGHTFRRALILSLLTLAVPSHAAQTAGNRPPAAQERPAVVRLVPGKPLRRVLSGNPPHKYSLKLASGDFVHVEVMQDGVDVELRLFAPDGRNIFTADSPNEDKGPESVMAVTEAAGTHLLEVSTGSQQPGHYEVRVIKLRAATPADGERVAAERVFMEATTPLVQGMAQRDARSLNAALAKYEESLRGSRRLKDSWREARTLYNIAFVHSYLGEPPKAIDAGAEALRIFRTLNDRIGTAKALSAVGHFHRQRGRADDALSHFEQAAPLFAGEKDYIDWAITLNDIGAIRSDRGEKREARGRYEQARLAYVQALRKRQSRKALQGLGTTLNNLAEVENALGDPLAAVGHLDRAFDIALEFGLHKLQAVVLNNRCHAREATGDAEKALGDCKRALPIFQALLDGAGEAKTLNNIGAIHEALGDAETALDFFQRALEIVKKAGPPADEATIRHNIGNLYVWMPGRRAEALTQYNEALHIHETLDDPFWQANTLNTLGHLYFLLQEPEQALRSYERALPLAKKIGRLSLVADMHNNIGLVYASMPERRGEALGYYEGALAVYGEMGNQYAQAAVLGNIGLFHEESGDRQKALHTYLRAIRLLENARHTTTVEEIRSRLSDPSGFVAKASLLLVRMGRPKEAFALTEMARSRLLLDQLGNVRPHTIRPKDQRLDREERRIRAELTALEEELGRAGDGPNAQATRDALVARYAVKQREFDHLFISRKAADSEYASLRTVRTLRLAEVQRQLDADTTLLSYFVTAENILAFVITRDSYRAVELPLREIDLQIPLGWFRRFTNLRSRRFEGLEQLHAWLIAPVAQHVRTRDVGIIPHRALHYLPFAALTDGRRYFGDDHTLFYLPSASVLPFIRQKKQGKPAGAGVLVMSQTRAEGGADLLYADREAEEVARLYGARAITTQEASAAEFIRQAGQYGVIHLAAHADLTAASPLFFNIRLGPKKDDEGVLEVSEIFNLNLHRTSMVVLSACETQLGKQNQGDDIVGLNRAFMYAGAPTVVASLWRVDDRVTSDLMVAFYKHLKAGKGKAAALSAAQSETREKHPHPYYWAAFVLSGDPGRMPLTPVREPRAGKTRRARHGLR